MSNSARVGRILSEVVAAAIFQSSGYHWAVDRPGAALFLLAMGILWLVFERRK